MADDKRVKLPASYGGIMQYYDEYKSKIAISPWIIVGATIAVMVIVVLMHVFGKY